MQFRHIFEHHNEEMKDTINHALLDIPAYAVIAWVKVVDAIPAEKTIETLFLDYGWILLLIIRLLNAFIDLYKRGKQNEFIIMENGEAKKVGILKSIIYELKNLLK